MTARARVTCPACLQPRIALTSRRRLYRHGNPACAYSGQRIPRIFWEPVLYGRTVQTRCGPDTWNPTTLEGAA